MTTSKKRPGRNYKHQPVEKRGKPTAGRPKPGTSDESGLNMTNISPPIAGDGVQGHDHPESGCGDSTGSVGDSGSDSSCDSPADSGGGGGD